MGRWALAVRAHPERCLRWALVLLVSGGCSGFEAGAQARAGLALSNGEVGFELGLREIRLTPCPERTGWLERLRDWFGPRVALAHGTIVDEPLRGPVIAGPAALELSERTVWMAPAPILPGAYCGLELALSAPDATGTAFVVHADGIRVEDRAPMQVFHRFSRRALWERGRIEVTLRFDSRRLKESLEGGAGGGEMRTRIRDALRVGVDVRTEEAAP